jgi:hypothetical protein
MISGTCECGSWSRADTSVRDCDRIRGHAMLLNQNCHGIGVVSKLRGWWRVHRETGLPAPESFLQEGAGT